MNILILFFTFISGLITTYLSKIFSEKTGLGFDQPEGDGLKIHKNKISIFGGLAIFISVTASLLCYSFFEMRGIVLAGLIIFLLGFWDDLKWKHASKSQPFLKFLLLILSVLLVACVLFLNNIGLNFFPLQILIIILTSIYVFTVINAVNYQDGIDGLASGLVAISLIGFVILGYYTQSDLVINISLICLSMIFSFMIFNFPPAKIFMGDSGAYFLGLILTIIAIYFSEPYNIYSVLGPFLIIGIPVIDGVFTNIRRLLAGKSIFYGDRMHFYDMMMKRYSIKKIFFLCYGLQIVVVTIGVIIYFYV